MPRFEASSAACLKRVMSTRSPHFVLSPVDVEAVMKETGLSRAQVMVWTDNFRCRYKSKSVEQVLEYLKRNEEEIERSLYKASRFFVSCFNVTLDFAKNFKFPKSRGQGGFTIRYFEAAFNSESGSGEFFLDFEENIYEYRLIECFQIQGAGQVYTMTFANNDGNESASSALFRVRETAVKTGSHYIQGVCSRLLKVKTETKWALANPVLHQTYQITPEIAEFDVVKKRRRMDEIASIEGDSTGDSPDALSRFEDFEQAVVGALTRIHVDDQENIRNEMLQMEEDQSSIMSGGVYVARCESLAGIVKIGATRRTDPTRRLWEISRYVPKPFQLIEWIPTTKPFTLEAQIHRKLASRRLKETGAGTEFFKLEEDEVQKMLESFKLSM